MNDTNLLSTFPFSLYLSLLLFSANFATTLPRAHFHVSHLPAATKK
jgi:hypothetical protein